MHLCGGNLLTLTGPDPQHCQKQLKKKQKNRVAAQRSRQKHTDKADALHQHESLEKHNHGLRKEIQALQAELERWNQTLRLHARSCRLDCSARQGPAPAGSGDHGQRGLGRQAPQSLLRTPAASPPAPRLPPDLRPHHAPGPRPSLFCHTAVTTPPAPLSPSPVRSAPPASSSLLGPSSKLSALLPSPPAQPAPPQHPGLEHPTGGKPGTPPHHPSAAPGPGLQGAPRPALWAGDWQGGAAGPSPQPLLAFPLLASAQVHF